MEEADIGYEWMAAYATITRRCRDDKDFGFSRYPYEQGPRVGQFNGGYAEHLNGQSAGEWNDTEVFAPSTSMRRIT
jgi:hypothetical protein